MGDYYFMHKCTLFAVALCFVGATLICSDTSSKRSVEADVHPETPWRYAVKIVSSLSSRSMTIAGLDTITTVQVPTDPSQPPVVTWKYATTSEVYACMQALGQVAVKTREAQIKVPALINSSGTLAAVYEPETDTLVRVAVNGDRFPKMIIYKGFSSTLLPKSKQ